MRKWMVCIFTVIILAFAVFFTVDFGIEVLPLFGKDGLLSGEFHAEDAWLSFILAAIFWVISISLAYCVDKE